MGWERVSIEAVDPARQKGQQLMDAGRVYFASDSKLDFEKQEAKTVKMASR